MSWENGADGKGAYVIMMYTSQIHHQGNQAASEIGEGQIMGDIIAEIAQHTAHKTLK